MISIQIITQAYDVIINCKSLTEGTKHVLAASDLHNLCGPLRKGQRSHLTLYSKSPYMIYALSSQTEVIALNRLADMPRKKIQIIGFTTLQPADTAMQEVINVIFNVILPLSLKCSRLIGRALGTIHNVTGRHLL